MISLHQILPIVRLRTLPINTCLVVSQKSILLFLNSLGSSLSGGLVSSTSSFSFFVEGLFSLSFSLSSDDVFNQVSLVLEGVTLGGLVQSVVQVLVDLASVSVLGQQSSQNSQSSHPDNLLRHTGVLGTLSLTVTGVSTSSLGFSQGSSSRSRVHSVRLLHNEAVSVQLSDGSTRVSVGDLSGFIGVEPDLSLTHANDGGSKSLLSSEISPIIVSFISTAIVDGGQVT